MLETYFTGVKDRILAHNWKMEGVVITLTLATVLLYVFGNYWNDTKFQKFITFESEKLREQFYQVGVTPRKLFIMDDEQHFVSYATGRINISRFIIKVTLQARQNFTMWLMENVFSFFAQTVDAAEDEIQIVANVHPDITLDPFIFAIVNKDNMNKERKDNYYLSLTKTTDSEKLPLQFVYMSESPEINELLYSEELRQVLDQSGDLLKLLAFTDQSPVHPFDLKETKPQFRAILKLHLKSDPSSLERTSNIINQFIELIDVVSSKKFKVRTEVVKKINKVRDAEVKKLEKLIEQDRKDQLEEKKLEELKKQKEQLRNINPKELEKLEKKQREKQQRKLAKKQRVRG